MTANLEEWVFRLAIATVAAVMVSIAAAQILLSLTLILWLLFRARAITWPGYCLPLAAFIVTTLMSLLISEDPSVGSGPIFKFVLFSMGLIAASFITDSKRIRLLAVSLISVAALVSVIALVQFTLQYIEYLASGNLADDPTILARITGLMGHWMTFSGQQMLVWCGMIPLAFGLGSRKYAILLSLTGIALLLSFTRGVWLGSIAGLAVAALYLPRRHLVRLLIPVGLVALLVSSLIIHRISMSFIEGGFAPDSSRLEMIDVGLRMVLDHPFFGVGPERIGIEFSSYYRGDNLENFFHGHLHNNFLQLAAERGLPCLAAFLWLIVCIGRDLKRKATTSQGLEKWVSVSGLSVLVSFVVAGLFEYNFGDSEVLMLFMFLVSVPYAVWTNDNRLDSARQLDEV